jgi:hypothetical protein
MPKYEGEDSRLTSRKELAGWYSYGWAAEVFAICAMGMAFTRAREAHADSDRLLFTHYPRTISTRSGRATQRQDYTMYGGLACGQYINLCKTTQA